jgi:hypothetical protein
MPAGDRVHERRRAAALARPTATRRGSRSPRSPGGSDGLRPPSRHACMTHLTLTKGLRKPRRDARRVWRPPAHKADPGLSRAERTPPWRGGASRTPDPVRRSSARQGALLERVREPAVGWQQPPVVRSAPLGDRGPTTDPDPRGYRNRGEPRVPCRAGGRLLSRLHRRGVATPDCCSHAPPAARDVCAAPLAPGHPRELGKHRIAQPRLMFCLWKQRCCTSTPTSSCTDSRTAPAMQSGLAPDDETSADRPFHKPGAGCAACPRGWRSRRTAVSSSRPIEQTATSRCACSSTPTTHARAIPAALPSPPRAVVLARANAALSELVRGESVGAVFGRLSTVASRRSSSAAV